MNVITSSPFLSLYVNIENDFDVDRLKPFERNSKTDFLNKYFNDALITQILSFAAEAIGTYKKEVYESLISAHANFTVRKYVNQGEVKISEFGITRVENEQTKTAYANQVKELKNDLEDTAHSSIGALIHLLENDSESIFTTNWQASIGYADRGKLLIKSAVIFNSIEPLYRHQTTFISLISQMIEVQEFYILPVIGSDLLAELITNAPAMIPVKKEARESILKAVANFTVAEALKKNLVKLTPSGVARFSEESVTSIDTITPGSPIETSPAYSSRIKMGIFWLNKAKIRLQEHGWIEVVTTTPKRFIA